MVEKRVSFTKLREGSLETVIYFVLKEKVFFIRMLTDEVLLPVYRTLLEAYVMMEAVL